MLASFVITGGPFLSFPHIVDILTNAHCNRVMLKKGVFLFDCKAARVVCFSQQSLQLRSRKKIERGGGKSTMQTEEGRERETTAVILPVGSADKCPRFFAHIIIIRTITAAANNFNPSLLLLDARREKVSVSLKINSVSINLYSLLHEASHQGCVVPNCGAEQLLSGEYE